MKLIAAAAFAGALVCVSNAAKFKEREGPIDAIDVEYKDDSPVVVKNTVFEDHGYTTERQHGNKIMEDDEEEQEEEEEEEDKEENDGDEKVIAQEIGGVWSDPQDIQDSIKIQKTDEEEEKSVKDKSKQEGTDAHAISSDDKEDDEVKSVADDEVEEDVQAAANEDTYDEVEFVSTDLDQGDKNLKAASDSKKEDETENVQAASVDSPAGSAETHRSTAIVPPADIKAASSSIGASSSGSTSSSGSSSSSSSPSDAMVFSRFIDPSVILALAGTLAWILV